MSGVPRWRSKPLLVAMAVLLAAAAVYLSVLIQQRQEALSKASRYDLSWAASQSAVELSRLGLSLGLYHISPTSKFARDISVRYEILLSRTALLDGSAFLAASSQDPTIRALIAETRQGIDDLEPLITSVNEGNNLRLAMELIAALAPKMTEFAAAANNFGASEADASQRDLLRLHQIFSAISLIIVLVGVFQLASLARQNRTLQSTQDQLEQQNARFEAAINNMPHGLAMFASDGSLTVGNRHLATILGVAESTLKIRKRLSEMVILAEENGSTIDSAILRDLTASLEAKDNNPLVLSLPDRRTLSISARVMADEGWVCTFEDITPRIEAEATRAHLEAQLQQAQKMEAIGQLTGGIAHDFNNLLTVILGNAELIAEGTLDAAKAQILARMILEASERGADLTQKLLAFGRRQSLRPERLNVSDAVSGMIPLLRRAIGEHIDLRTNFAGQSSTALVDRSLLESAVLNLAVNARDAMPQGGSLTISTGERIAREGEGALRPGERAVFVRVTDTGTGISPDVLPRVFDPFFTTKEVGKGSGLGLAMVYGFAHQSGGHVDIDSQVGDGTSITILLPSAPHELAAPFAEPIPVPSPVRGEGQILLVEDEADVLTFVASQLHELGYDVTTASTGAEALMIMDQGANYDLLLTDVVLPGGISGVELARRARLVNPELKVLLTSGYSEDVFRQHGSAGDLPLLCKPYRRAELAEAVKATLNQPSRITV